MKVINALILLELVNMGLLTTPDDVIFLYEQEITNKTISAQTQEDKINKTKQTYAQMRTKIEMDDEFSNASVKKTILEGINLAEEESLKMIQANCKKDKTENEIRLDCWISYLQINSSLDTGVFYKPPSDKNQGFFRRKHPLSSKNVWFAKTYDQSFIGYAYNKEDGSNDDYMILFSVKDFIVNWKSPVVVLQNRPGTSLSKLLKGWIRTNDTNSPVSNSRNVFVDINSLPQNKRPKVFSYSELDLATQIETWKDSIPK